MKHLRPGAAEIAFVSIAIGHAVSSLCLLGFVLWTTMAVAERFGRG